MKECYLLEPARAKNINPRDLARGLGWLEPSQENSGSARLGSEKTGSRRPLQTGEGKKRRGKKEGQEGEEREAAGKGKNDFGCCYLLNGVEKSKEKDVHNSHKPN